MNNDSFPTGNQASVYAKHSLYHWATALAIANDFLEWGLRKRWSQGPRNRPRQREMIGVQIKPSCGTWQLQKAVQRKRPPSSVTGPWGRPERGVSDDSAVTCGEPAKGLPGTGGSRRGNDVYGGLATYTCWHICGFPSRKGLLRHSAFCSWVKI